MTTKSKKKYITDSYVKKLVDARSAIAERKEYLKEFSTKPKKSKGNSNGESTGISGVALNGEMPTVGQYNGPNDYRDEIINGVYQTGIKNRLKGTDKWNDAIKKAAGKAGVNPLLVKIIMATESSGNHSATPNPYNCVGLMQVQGDTAKGLGLDWAKVKSDPEYNIYAGCLVIKGKHTNAGSVIKGKGEKYSRFKSQGYELKANVHGVAWLYNGFSVPSNGSNVVTTGGYIYANQVAAMYKGFGRDPYKDTALTLDSLGESKGKSSSKEKDKKSSDKKDAKASVSSMDSTTVNSDGKKVIVTGRDIQETEALLAHINANQYRVPVGKVKGFNYTAPKYVREKYVEDRKLSALFVNKEGYRQLPPNEFIHLTEPYHNFYAPEAYECFKVLKENLGSRNLQVIRGFEPDPMDGSSHSVGIAMDIYSNSPAESIRIADIAWKMGIRCIAIGPHFVHVDCGPEAAWGYDDYPIYAGPKSVRLRDFK